MLRQIAIVSLLNFRNLGSRAWSSLVIVASMICVIGVLLSMLSLSEGLHQAYLNAGDPSAVIITSRGAQNEGNSSIPRDQARIITNAPGIARAADGSAIADPGIQAYAPAVLKATGSRNGISIRGISDKGLLLQPRLHLVAGRMFRAGTHELIAGTGAAFQFKNMNVGDKVVLQDGAWTIVGSFTSNDVLDSRLIGDVETLMQAVRRKAYNTVLVKLESPAAFTTLRNALTKNPALSVDVTRVPEWNTKSTAGFITFFHVIIYGIGVILAVGALFGCVNTMYAAVQVRGREIATLRALGFGGFAVAASVILEAVALCVLGALIGAAIAWSLYDGVRDGLGNDVFIMTVSPGLIGIALLWAIIVALLGGLLPAIRAARRPVTDALRAS